MQNKGQVQATGKTLVRAPIIFSNSQAHNMHNSQDIQMNQQQNSTNRTKQALCFLCLFDGLRTPSVRRLVRKPRTVCEKPLLTFDPTFYAPESKNFVQEIYYEILGCPVEIKVDPSAQTVLQLLRNYISIQPQRILIHYYGHGCHAPSDDGSLFFFSEDRARYKPIRITNLMNNYKSPITFVIDAPNAASLYRYIQSKSDTFAFFATSQGESLPCSTDAPLDLFSSCLLTPFDTALWFHKRHHSGVHIVEKNIAETEKDRLKKFLNRILESILFDTQPSSLYEKFAKDPSVFALARGFVLSQRILTAFNIHPTSIPEIEPTDSHRLWGLWDTALDCCLTMSSLDKVTDTIFELFSISFDSFPTTSVFPLFSYYLRTPFHSECARRLLMFIDTTEGAASTCARSSIPSVIVSLEKPSATSLVILAKTIAAEKSSPFTQQTPISFAVSKEPGILKAGMLAICCSIATSPYTSFNRLTHVCIDRASQCAPFSALLLGLLVERAGRLMNLPPFVEKFVPLLKKGRQEIKASVLFLLSTTQETSLMPIIIPFLADRSPLVRSQAVWAVGKFAFIMHDQEMIDKILSMKDDPDPSVRYAVEAISPAFAEHHNEEEEDPQGEVTFPQNQVLLQMLMKSVNATKFMERFEDDLFMTNQ